MTIEGIESWEQHVCQAVLFLSGAVELYELQEFICGSCMVRWTGACLLLQCPCRLILAPKKFEIEHSLAHIPGLVTCIVVSVAENL